MPPTPPRASIVCPSYNHSRFVREAVLSLLAQTERDIEIILIDDASTDGNLDPIRDLADPRLRVVSRQFNKGVAAGMNEGFALARADIICLFATDDIADPRYVEGILEAFRDEPAAVAAYVENTPVGADGRPLGPRRSLPAHGDRLHLLRESFLGGNQFPSPGMAVRREHALRAHVPEGVVQYSDWIFNNRLLLLGPPALVRTPLLSYRVSDGSLSARTDAQLARCALEMDIVMDSFVSSASVSDAAEILGVGPQDAPSVRLMPFMLARHALRSRDPLKRSWGYRTMIREFSDAAVAEELRLREGYGFAAFLSQLPVPDGSPSLVVSDALRRQRRWKAVALASALLAALGIALAAST